MEHTKKFVLVDPRFVRPSMRDKVLSALDTDISNILNSDEPDEVKARNYIATLSRFKSISAPPKPEKPLLPAASPIPPVPQLPSVPSVAFKATSSRKRPHKRVKVESVLTEDPTLWRRTQRTPTKKKFGPQWISYNDSSPKKKKKSLNNWIES